VSNNFSTRCLKMSYKFCASNSEKTELCTNALNAVLTKLFFTGYRISKASCLIYVPVDCNYFKIFIALRDEFKDQPMLKGMKFRIDLWERMREV
jgi:hypothetical protein